MSLVDDYLRAVAGHLPKAGRDDILAELRDLVLTRIEAREAALGRPLTEDETETVLREVGHPLVVAGRYGSGPQHVVGPTLYPYWLFGVKAALAILVCAVGLGLIVRLGAGQWPWRAIPQAIASIFGGAVSIVGLATLLAWAVERRYVQAPWLENWRVRDLRVLELGAWDWEAWRERVGGWSASPTTATTPSTGPTLRSPRRREPRSEVGEAVGNIAFGLVFLLWWVGAIHLFGGGVDDWREVGLEPGGLADFDWNGLKTLIFAPGLVYATATMGQGLFMLMRPDDLRGRGVFNLLIGAGVGALSSWLMWLSPLAPHVAVGSLAELVSTAQATFEEGAPFPLAWIATLVLAFSLLGGALRMLKGVVQLLTPARRGFSPTAPTAALQSSSPGT